MRKEQDEEHGTFYVTQSVAIFNGNGSLLALRHRTGRWLFAGGHIDRGEDWRTALTWELQKEAGIVDVEIEGIFQVDSWMNPEGPQYGVYFLGKVGSDKVELSDEHIEYRWLVSLQEMETLDWWVPALRGRAVAAWKKYNGER